MNLRGWMGTLGYFLLGCGLLILCGMLVSSLTHENLIRVSVSQATAQEEAPPPPAPEALPGPSPEPVPEGLPAPSAEAEIPVELDESQVEVPEKRELGILDGIIVDFFYKGDGRRDPFAIINAAPVPQETGPPIGPVTELERFDLDQLRLIGIIWGVPKPKALLIDPQSRTHVVYKKTRVGRNNGYVAEIREGEIVVIESFNNEGRVSYNPRLIRLQRE